MVTSADFPPTQIEYPDEDGKPMAEGDIQRKYLTYCTEALAIYFKNRSDIYVAGNLFIYYEEGNPASVVAPDVFVIIGISSENRRSYKTWENHDKAPDFVLEITSKTTRSQDQGAKKGTYAFLGVREYFQYDPTDDYLNPPLQGLRLSEGNYLPLPLTTTEGTLSLQSSILGLDLQVEDGALRFYDPVTHQKLLAHDELDQALQQAEQARQAAEQARQAAEQRANQEVAARQAIESRLAELEAQIKALQNDSNP